jgi:alpha-N-acetylglucosamine transferase
VTLRARWVTQSEYTKVLLLDMDTVMVRGVDELWARDVPIVYTRPGGDTKEPLQARALLNFKHPVGTLIEIPIEF